MGSVEAIYLYRLTLSKKRKMPNINTTKQGINTVIILAGAGLLLFDFIVKPVEVYYKIGGLVILMFGLYKSTRQWTSDNKGNAPEGDNDQGNGQI